MSIPNGEDEAARRKSPRAWTEADDAELRSRLASRQQTAQIAHEMERTVDAIRGRAQALGLGLTPRGRPWRSYPKRD